MWDLLGCYDTLTVNTPLVLIEIANFSIWLSSAEAKTACRLFMGLRNTLSNSSLFIIQEVLC